MGVEVLGLVVLEGESDAVNVVVVVATPRVAGTGGGVSFRDVAVGGKVAIGEEEVVGEAGEEGPAENHGQPQPIVIVVDGVSRGININIQL